MRGPRPHVRVRLSASHHHLVALIASQPARRVGLPHELPPWPTRLTKPASPEVPLEYELAGEREETEWLAAP